MAPTGSRAFRNSTGSGSGRGVQGHRAGLSPTADRRPGTWSFVWLFHHGHVAIAKRQSIPFGAPAPHRFLGWM